MKTEQTDFLIAALQADLDNLYNDLRIAKRNLRIAIDFEDFCNLSQLSANCVATQKKIQSLENSINRREKYI